MDCGGGVCGGVICGGVEFCDVEGEFVRKSGFENAYPVGDSVLHNCAVNILNLDKEIMGLN